MPVLIAVFLLSAAVSPPPDDDDDKPQSVRPPITAPRPDNAETKPRRQNVAPPAADADDDKPKTGTTLQASQHDADDDDDQEGRVQPNTAVVVTAHRLDAARTQIDAGLGATVYSLNNDTIEDRPGGETGSIADILVQSPGVTVVGENVMIRGSKDIQVRVNNVIIPEAISDPADHLSARLAQSTRVLTGTLPAQFGFVPAGVISLTTKNGLYQHGGELELYGASDAFIEPAVEWAGSALDTSMFGSVSLEADRTDVADLNGTRTRDHRREIGGMAFADHILGPSDRVSLIVGGDDERHRFGQTSLPAGTQQSADAYGVATYQHSAEDFTLQGSLFVGGGTDHGLFVERTREHRTTFGTQIDTSYNIGAVHVLKAGLLASHATADEHDLGGTKFADQRNSVGVYGQDEWKLSSTLTFNPGLRLDWLRGLGNRATLEPRASFVWALSNGLSAHIGYARYANAAALGEDQATIRLPDERDDYFDGGVQYRIGVLTLGADAYARNTRNFLDHHQKIGSSVAQSFAFRAARFRGLELSATYSTHPVSAWLNLSVSKARGHRIIDEAGIFSAASLAAASLHWVALSSDRPVTASAGVTWRRQKLAFSATVDASSGAVRSPALAEPNGAREGAYATVGLSAIYHAGRSNLRRDFRVDLTNLTNTHYRVNDATNLEGGWSRWGRGRAITLGFEQGF